MTFEEYNPYDAGEVVTISMSFKDRNEVPTSPSAILLQLRDPTTAEISEIVETAMTEDSEGEWHLDVDTTDFVSGVWYYKVYAQGDSQSAREWAFIIKASELS